MGRWILVTSKRMFNGKGNAPKGSEHKVSVSVNILESLGSAFIKNTLRIKALVLIKSVGSHASSE